MNFEDMSDLDGPMVDYDFYLMGFAESALAELKQLPSFRWWHWFLRRPRFRPKEPGCGSFLARNPSHPISQEIFLEYKRAFGRSPSIRDIGL